MCNMNSTKLKRKLAQRSARALALRNDSKLKRTPNRKTYYLDKTDPSSAKIINEVIQIKRKRIKYMKSAFGDTDSAKSSDSRSSSVVYVGTQYPKLSNLVSIIDLTKSDSDLIHPKRKERKPRREMNNKQITTIQSANNLACRSSEDIGLVVKNLNEANAGTTKSTKSGIQLKRTQPRTSMSGAESVKNDDDDENIDALAPVDDTEHFLNEVSDMINRDLKHINEIEKMVYEMDIDTMVELYNVNALDNLDGFDT